MATTTIDLLKDNNLRGQVKDDWEKRMRGRRYKSPLPLDLKPPLDQLKKH